MHTWPRNAISAARIALMRPHEQGLHLSSAGCPRARAGNTRPLLTGSNRARIAEHTNCRALFVARSHVAPQLRFQVQAVVRLSQLLLALHGRVSLTAAVCRGSCCTALRWRRQPKPRANARAPTLVTPQLQPVSQRACVCCAMLGQGSDKGLRPSCRASAKPAQAPAAHRPGIFEHAARGAAACGPCARAHAARRISQRAQAPAARR